LHNQQKKNEIEQQLENKQLGECSFQPATNKAYNQKLSEKMNSCGDRRMDLYNSVPKGAYSMKHNKDREEHEYDKCYLECTMKP
jgi:hypothetical protein